MIDDVLIFLKRHVIVLDAEKHEPDKSISIDGKTIFLNSNKKRIKNKIFEVIKKKLPYSVDDEEKKRNAFKLIKRYIDKIRQIQKKED